MASGSRKGDHSLVFDLQLETSPALTLRIEEDL